MTKFRKLDATRHSVAFNENRRLARLTPFVLFLSFVAALCILSSPAIGQDRKFEGMLPEVSSEEKRDFFKRLDRYFELDRDRRWSEVFELSIDLVMKGEEHRPTFVEIRNARVITRDQIDFVPVTSTFVNMLEESRIWLVEGCGFQHRSAKRRTVRYGLSAMLHKGQWYFDDLAVLSDGVGGKPLSCS